MNDEPLIVTSTKSSKKITTVSYTRRRLAYQPKREGEFGGSIGKVFNSVSNQIIKGKDNMLDLITGE